MSQAAKPETGTETAAAKAGDKPADATATVTKEPDDGMVDVDTGADQPHPHEMARDGMKAAAHAALDAVFAGEMDVNEGLKAIKKYLSDHDDYDPDVEQGDDGEGETPDPDDNSDDEEKALDTLRSVVKAAVEDAVRPLREELDGVTEALELMTK